MPSRIARTARVDARAQLDEDADIGPGCVIGPDVRIGRGTRLTSNVCLLGVVKLGEFNTIRPFVAIGGTPQDLSYREAPTRVEIGDHNTIGERVTIHRGSEKDDGVTRIGSHNEFLEGVARRPRLQARRSDLGRDRLDARGPRARRVGCHHHGEGGRPSIRDGRRPQLHRRPLEDHAGRAVLHAGRG